MDFAILDDLRVKLKESENKDKYLTIHSCEPVINPKDKYSRVCVVSMSTFEALRHMPGQPGGIPVPASNLCLYLHYTCLPRVFAVLINNTWTMQGNWKKLWIMKVTIIPIVIRALGTVTEGLVKGLEDFEIRERMETIQTTALLRSDRILRRVLETWGDLLSLKLR